MPVKSRTVKMLEEAVVQAVVYQADEHDYCEEGVIEFLCDALMVDQQAAEKLYDKYRGKTRMKLVLDFETTHGDIWTGNIDDASLKNMINDHLLDGYSRDTINIISSSYKEVK